jgi:hypothetical protein
MNRPADTARNATVHLGAAHGLACNYPAAAPSGDLGGTALPTPRAPDVRSKRRFLPPLGNANSDVIAVALGLAAVVTAAAVYRNEQEDHNADKDFHAATSYLVSAVDAGIASRRGRKLEALAEKAEHDAEDHQERATHYTLAEVILAVSLFLFGIAGSARFG